MHINHNDGHILEWKEDLHHCLQSSGEMDDFSHAQSTVKCAFNHPEKAPWFVCVAAGIYISKHPSY